MRHILYFIGAGLSKSLQVPTRPIPMMLDFTTVLADYLNDNVILTTLARLETNNPHPYKWKSTEAIQVARRLVGKDAVRTVANRQIFAEALKNRPSESIEALLAKAVSRGDTEAADRFVYAINRVFRLVNWRVRWAPLNLFLKNQFALEGKHTFVNFNYDLLLDRAIQMVSNAAWDPNGGYGFPIDFYVRDEAPLMPAAGNLATAPAYPLEAVESSRKIVLLKPHGSLNWLVPLRMPFSSGPTGLRFRPDGPLIVALTGVRQIRYWFSKRDFQYIEVPGHLPYDVRPYIIIPTESKHSSFSFIKKTRKLETSAIEHADEIYVVGWSLPKTDQDQEEMIRSAIGKRKTPLERLTVVSRGSPPQYFSRFAKLFGVPNGKVRVFNGGFEAFAEMGSIN